MNSYSPSELLDIFNKGLRIDIEALFKIPNRSAHMEYNFNFVAA